MRIHHAAFFILACATPVLLSAQSSPAPAQTTKRTDKMLKLSGCVAAAPTAGDGFTLSDATEGTTYRLSGTDMHEYLGRPVQVIGMPSRRLKIVGGLYPSPNVAAQAGGIDPASPAASEAAATAGHGTQLPEIRVRSVKPLVGIDCPEAK